MRFIAKILALYFSVVAFMPCHDMQMDCTMTCSTHVSTTDSHPESEEHQEACPPLCACSCCGIIGAISPKTIIWDFTPLKPYTISAFYYDSPKGISHQNNIWQPPKVA